MKNKYYVFIFFSVVLLLQFYIFHHFWLTVAGQYLVYQDDIKPADAILVLGGGRKERVSQGVELYKNGYGAKVLFTGMPERVAPGEKLNWAISAQKFAGIEGLPKDKSILILESKSTHDDAALSKEVCFQNNFKSLIVVTEPYHTRRSFYVFKKAFKGSGVKIMICPVQNSWYQPNDWWQTEDGFMYTSSEFVKLIYYFLKGYI